MKQLNWRFTRRHGLVAMAALALAGCATTRQSSGPVFGEVAVPRGSAALLLERRLGEIVAEQHVITAGVGVIKDGELAWSAYFGEQSPGVPASAATRFNTASITKTVTAETILRLVGQGRLSLDESMANYWVDPDIAGDPRRFDLTPRIALTHKTGFPNWRFFRRDGKLAFERAPGVSYGYSGEGFQYLARFAEKKLGKPFPQLVDETVLKPVGMAHTDFTVRAENADQIARPVDKSGVFYGYFCRPEGKAFCRKQGDWSAAADMTTTVQDYAAFLIAVMDANGYGPAIVSDRDRVQSDKGGERVVHCEDAANSPCPVEQGYGLGFNVLKYDGVTVLEHGGADWAQLAVAYFYKPSRDGVIIFLNAPNRRALEAMPGMLALVDPTSPLLGEYSRWLETAEANEVKP